jgi:hypothetical protein
LVPSQGRALWGEDKEKFKAWIKPPVRQLKNESAVKVIRQLDEALAPAGGTGGRSGDQSSGLPAGTSRPDGLPGRAAGGRTDRQRSGGSDLPTSAVPLQAPGQFWSPIGDEALLCLETFWRNERWSLLFPHAFDPAKN